VEKRQFLQQIQDGADATPLGPFFANFDWIFMRFFNSGHHPLLL